MHKRAIVAVVLASSFICYYTFRRYVTEAATTTHVCPSEPHQDSNIVLHKHSGSIDTVRSLRRQAAVSQIIKSFNTPVEFYGKIVDQHGSPVPGAEVRYTFTDKFMASGSGGRTVSDRDGTFTISGKGAAISVTVSKETSHYMVPGRSHRLFANGLGPDSTHEAPAPFGSPTIFELHRKGGEVESLVHVPIRTINVPSSGDLTSIKLFTLETRPVDLEVFFVREEVETFPYRWKFVLKVPNGALMEREDPMAFQAPESGYKSSVSVGQEPADDGKYEHWGSYANKSYFLRFNEGFNARIDMYFSANDSSVRIEAYLNPTGSRNLEIDPAKNAIQVYK